MSKKVEAKITCPVCSHQFDFSLYRTIWGEYPENRDLVMGDKINVAICPSCNRSTKLVYPFMYTNVKKFFAVWWEPVYDPQIDKDTEGYKKMFGPQNYLAAAPRVKDWGEFKNTILKFELGDLRGQPGALSNDMQKELQGFVKHLQNQNNKRQNSGCLGIVFLMVLSCSVLYGLSTLVF